MGGIKYSTATVSNTVKLGNFVIGNDPNIAYGPTSLTGFYALTSIPSGGYVIYGNKATQGPSVYVCQNDEELIFISSKIANQNFSTFSECVNYFNAQSDSMIFDKDVPGIVSDGLAFYLNAGILKSYARSGATWSDLSGSNNRGTLTNGPTYASDNGGYIILDGVDDVINFASPVISNQWTLSYWGKFNVEKIKSTQYYTTLTSNSGSLLGRNLLEFTHSFTLYSIKTDSSGNIYIGGRICEYNGTERHLIAKLDSSGNIINTFSPNLVMNQTQDITDIEIDSSGNLYYVGYNIGNLTKINPTTGAQIQQIQTVNASITQANLLLDEANDKAYIGGWFTSIQGVSAQRIARINLSTMTIDSTFNTTTGFVNTEDVQMMVLQPDGKLIVGGQFTSYKGSTYNRIIRLNSDASIDTSFNPGTGFTGSSGTIRIYRNCIALQSDGKILCAGEFTQFNGVSANRIARLNSDGSRDNSFSIGTGFNNTVNCLVLLSDGKILVGGSFTSYNGVSVDRIVRLNSDGTRDTTFNSGGSGSNNEVFSIFIQSDNKIIIGGRFTTYNGSTANEICRLNSDGTLDNTFSSGTGIIGAYRLNNQFTYKNTPTTFTTQFLYTITKPVGYNWNSFQTASMPFDNFFNYSLTKNSSGLYSQYWNGQLVQTVNLSAATDTSLNINMIGVSKGYLSNISIYNRSLSSTEVLQNYQSQYSSILGLNIVTDGLILYLDGGLSLSYPTRGTVWYDITGNGSNGTLTNSPTYNSDNNGSLVFDGVDDYIEMTSNVNSLNTLQSGTIEQWVRLDSSLSSCTTFFIGTDVNNRFEFTFGNRGSVVNEATGIIVFEGGVQTLVFFLIQSSSNFYFDNQWHQFVYKSDSTGNSFYVDGQKQVVSYSNGDSSTQKFFNLSTTPTICNIGRRILSGVPSQLTKGRMSITRVYNRALTDNEVLQNFNAQKSRYGL